MGMFDKWSRNKQETEKPPSEDTPFAHTPKENLKAAPEYVKRQALKLYELGKEGPLSFRVLAFLGGLAMVAASIFDFVVYFIPGTKKPSVLIAIYTLLFGVGICILEGRIFEVPASWQRTMKFYFRILDFTWGRGLMYAFVGSLQLTQPNIVNLVVGNFMVLVAVFAVVAALGAGHKLAELRAEIDSQRNLKTYFNEFDENKDGALTQREFATLVGGLGVECTSNELVACFNAIDKNDDEEITYDEFKGWWTEWGQKNLHRDMSDLQIMSSLVV